MKCDEKTNLTITSAQDKPANERDGFQPQLDDACLRAWEAVFLGRQGFYDIPDIRVEDITEGRLGILGWCRRLCREIPLVLFFGVPSSGALGAIERVVTREMWPTEEFGRLSKAEKNQRAEDLQYLHEYFTEREYPDISTRLGRRALSLRLALERRFRPGARQVESASEVK